jgi:hypothetical protein
VNPARLVHIACGLVALLLAAAPAWSELPRGAAASVYAGFELGNTDSRRMDAGASVQFRESWNASAQVARAEFELPDADMVSTVFNVKLSHDFGKFGVGVGIRQGEIEDVVSTDGIFAAAFVDQDALRFTLEIESRGSDLAPAPFTEDLGDGAGVQSGVSRCSVDSLGYQAQVNVDRPAWAAFAAYRFFDYDDFDCAVTPNVNTGGPPAHARGRALGRRLGAGAIQPVTGFSSRLIPREAALLESSVALGVVVPLRDRWLAGVDLYRDQELVAGNSYSTALAFAAYQFTMTWTVELTVGYSDAEVVEDTAFAGLRVIASL